MGLFNLFSKKTSSQITAVHGSRIICGVKNANKSTLLSLQKLCVPGTKKLSLSADKIIATCDSILSQHNHILEDCKKIIFSTDNPTTFFSRYDLLIEKLEKMAEFEPYIEFYGYQPKESLTYYINQKKSFIKKMIDRRYNKALIKADTLKTDKAKKNQFIKAYTELKENAAFIDSENLAYVESKFKNKI